MLCIYSKYTHYFSTSKIVCVAYRQVCILDTCAPPNSCIYVPQSILLTVIGQYHGGSILCEEAIHPSTFWIHMRNKKKNEDRSKAEVNYLKMNKYNKINIKLMSECY